MSVYFNKFLYIKNKGLNTYMKNFEIVDECHNKEVVNGMVKSHIGVLKVTEDNTTSKKKQNGGMCL